MFTKKYFLALALLFSMANYSQNKFSVGAGGGILNFGKNTNVFNENIFVGYNVSDKITIGADAIFVNQFKIDGVSNSANVFLTYIEIGNSQSSFISDKIYSSVFIGGGYIEQKNTFENQNGGVLNAGLKINYKLTEKFILGLKTGYYFSKLDNAILANLFLAYKI